VSKTDRLRELIAKTIEEDPYEFEGFEWAARPQDDWCARLDCSVATLRRLIAQPPIVRDRARVNGRIVTLLREGEPGPKTVRHLANTMSCIWRKRFGRSVGRKDYGCLVGLAESWPEGYAVEIFKAALDDWPMFMVGVKGVIALEGGNGKELYLKYPSITVMRRFPKVGIELYVMQLQEQLAKQEQEKLGLQWK
jgi:hypothetical protein